MYANGVQLDELSMLTSQGETSGNDWFQAAYQKDDLSRGAYIFAQDCMVCHTTSGINAIYERLQGRTEDGIFVFLGHTHEFVPFMPPFAGSDNERKITARYLFQVAKGNVHFSSQSRSILDTAGGQQ
jgi:hypothetical protein